MVTVAQTSGSLNISIRLTNLDRISIYSGKCLPACLINQTGVFSVFILFRLFDIKKPFPVSYFDKNFKNSFGVVMDDVIAGLYVVLVLIISMVIKSYFSL